MSLVKQRAGTEKPRQLVWGSSFQDTMFVAPHRLGKRMEFYVIHRKEGWELSTANNDGTGGKVLFVGKTEQEAKDFAQKLVNEGN